MAFTIRMKIDNSAEKKYHLQTVEPEETEEQERSDNNGVNDQNAD